jgi:hypothetical protein
LATKAHLRTLAQGPSFFLGLMTSGEMKFEYSNRKGSRPKALPFCCARAMRSLRSQFVRNAGCLTGLAALLLGLPGCQTITGVSSGAQVRIIDASPNANGLDIYPGGVAMAYNLGFGTVSSYVSVSPGASTITADTAGSKQVLTTAAATYAASAQYTVLIGNIAADMQETVLTDQSLPAPAGEISLRVLDQATRYTGGVDVYLVPSGSTLAASAPILTNVLFGSNSGYINVPAGTYSIDLLPTGTAATATTVPTYSGPATAYGVGAARTILLLDNQVLTNPGFQVVIAHDYDSPAATS